jgi:hypothetical protein
MDDSNPQPTEVLAINGDQFTLPPLLRRQFVIELDISRAAFDERALALMEELQVDGHFDVKKMKERWEFRLEVKNQVPRPKVRLTQSPQIIRKARESNPMTSLELFPPTEIQPARFILEQDRSDEHPTRFEDLEAEIHQWLPKVLSRFDIEKVGGFALFYQNEFRQKRYPQFWEGEEVLLPGTILRLFHNAYDCGTFVPPLAVEFNTEAEGFAEARLHFQMKTTKPGKDFGLDLNLEFTSLGRNQRITLDQARSEIRMAHGLLFDIFVRHLSPEALKAFTP